MFICGFFSVISTLFSGDHRNDDGEWIAFKDGLNTTLILYTLGIVLIIIDKIRNKKNKL